MKLFAFIVVVSLFAFAVQQDGCNFPETKKPAAPIDLSAGMVPKRTTCSADHRFERTEIYPVAMRADIALDSCTGQLCRTWQWGVKNPNASPWAPYADLPLCADLARQR